MRHFPSLVDAGHVYVAMPPLYRIDLGKEVHYALDESEKAAILKQLANKRGTPNVQRFKGLGEMSPLQLRETTMSTETRRLVQLTLTDGDGTMEMMDMLLAKKRAGDRKNGWKITATSLISRFDYASDRAWSCECGAAATLRFLFLKPITTTRCIEINMPDKNFTLKGERRCLKRYLGS
ncbi:hypothetical protein HORIV_24470 [Vreelandella olivaria]|uniref:DNA topoisomerase (ATP-hydrolyzing) n=1 Tax=Vreelandella olivaria TaxID=390919 RepID=A0ABN5WZP0_9GAMM|nr:hypothetical protein HORIV_24470 [Halomonas olivaria]